MCARAELSLVVAWSARGQPVCVSVEEFTGLRSPHAHVIPHGALRFDWIWRGTVRDLLILASPCFSKLWFIFNGLIPRSCFTLPLLSFHLAAA